MHPANSDTIQPIPAKDRAVLRDLAAKKAEISLMPIQEERRRLWARLNDLDPVRPMAWPFEVPWNEMNVNDELTLLTGHPLCQRLERSLRQELYQWNHMQADMVVQHVIYVPPPLADSGFGLAEKVDLAITDKASSVVSRHFHVQIRDENDIDKIRMPVITLDSGAWDKNYALLAELFDGVIPVEKTGIKATSIAPWDWLVRITGVEPVLLDMATRPAYVRKLVDRLTAAYLCRLEQ